MDNDQTVFQRPSSQMVPNHAVEPASAFLPPVQPPVQPAPPPIQEAPVTPIQATVNSVPSEQLYTGSSVESGGANEP